MNKLTKTQIVYIYDISNPTLKKKIDAGEFKTFDGKYIDESEVNKILTKRTSVAENLENLNDEEVDSSEVLLKAKMQYEISRAIKEEELAKKATRENELFKLKYIEVKQVNLIFEHLGIEVKSAFENFKNQQSQDLAITENVVDVEDILNKYYKLTITRIEDAFKKDLKNSQNKIKEKFIK